MAQLTVVRDETEVSAQAAERITSLIEGAIVIRDAAAISLAGGNTPERLYEFLADPDHPWRARIDWTRTHLFWSDERNVPPDHPDSNFGLAHRTLIQHVPIPLSHVHRMRGELAAVEAAREYDGLLRARRSETEGPLFDVMLLGIGADAHMASIFPGSPLLASSTSRASVSGSPRWPEEPVPRGHSDSCCADFSGPRELAAGIWVRQLNQWRITLTPPALLDSTAIIVIAAGSRKADAIAAAIEADLDVVRYPAQLLREQGDRVEWIVDEPAAARLRLRRDSQ